MFDVGAAGAFRDPVAACATILALMAPSSDSHELAREKFDTAEQAAAYSRKFVGTRKDALEKARIEAALLGVPPGSRVLDLPCGTGRMTTFLVRLGYRVTAADASAHMLNLARQRVTAELKELNLPGRVELCEQDVLALTFAAGSFDAVVCNRLFHHFSEPATRRKALAELARVSKGPVVVSFFRTLSLSALWRRILNRLRGVKQVDRIPIPLRAFREDAESVGLVVAEVLPVRFGISPQTYVRLEQAESPRRKPAS